MATTRYQVFVASVRGDGQRHDDAEPHDTDAEPLGMDLYRRTVKAAIEAEGLEPEMMEDFSAANPKAIDLCREKVDNCEIMVLLIGHRYGSQPKGESKSFTELEYEHAQKRGKQIIPFIASDKTNTGEAPDTDPEKIAKLKNFRQRVQDRHSPQPLTDVSAFTSSDDRRRKFEELVRSSLRDAENKIRISKGRRRRRAWFVVVGAALVAGLVAIGAYRVIVRQHPSPPPPPTVLVWWVQDTMAPVWHEVASDFAAEHPTIERVVVVPKSVATLQGDAMVKALTDGSPPDLFEQYGGAGLREQVASGLVKDITRDVGPQMALIGASIEPWLVSGNAYGLPYNVGIEGFWYNKALFAQAGITAVPTTMPEFDRVVAQLKAAGITPITVGARDSWTVAHYWHNFAVRRCPVPTLRQATREKAFTDPCFLAAGEDLRAFIKTNPFPENALQLGQFESAAAFATGGAAMELQGHFHPSIMEKAAPGAMAPENLGWFPFPSVPGGQGDAVAALGGGGGFSCSAAAPPACVDLLKYVVSVEVQSSLGSGGEALPVTKGAEVGVSPVLRPLMTYRNDASYIQQWFDIAIGIEVGEALNDAVVDLLDGHGSPQAIVDAANRALP